MMNEVPFALYIGSIARICALLLIGIPLVKWLSNICAEFCKKHFSQHVGVLVDHVIFYSGLIFIAVTVLHECGFNVTALIGAAGVFGIAIGFASQTSISNIISGFFLLLERPFSVGDIIKNDDMVGVVESIDLLSVRVRTLDNKMVRLPNEMVLKHSLINLTYYPVKRIDCIVSVNYADDVSSAINGIYDVIKNNQLFLTNPAPVVMVHKMASPELSNEIRLYFMVRVWVAKEQFTTAPAVLMEQIKAEFDQKRSIITAVQVNN